MSLVNYIIRHFDPGTKLRDDFNTGKWWGAYQCIYLFQNLHKLLRSDLDLVVQFAQGLCLKLLGQEALQNQPRRALSVRRT